MRHPRYIRLRIIFLGGRKEERGKEGGEKEGRRGGGKGEGRMGWERRGKEGGKEKSHTHKRDYK